MSNFANATAAALDMCRDWRIPPEDVPNPDGVPLTQPMVQRYKDELDRKGELADLEKRPALAPAEPAPNATAAALDMCRELKIDPAKVPCPEGEELTQVMVQRYKDELAESAERDDESQPDLSKLKKADLEAIAAGLGLAVDGTKAELIAAIEGAKNA